MLKRIMIFLVSILLLLNSALVNASIGGWTLSNPTAVGASILYDGTKGAATSSILISPNASQIAKVLRGGIAGYALTFAVEQLLGAVDWVLDPANNQIIYKVLPEPKPDNSFCISYKTSTYCSHNHNESAQKFAEAQMTYFNQTMTTYEIQRGLTIVSAIVVDQSSIYISHNKRVSTFYVVFKNKQGRESKGGAYAVYAPITPSISEEATLSLITVAEQVIENAENDNLDAQFSILAAATNILSDAEQDDVKAKPIANELENNTKCPSGIVRNGSCWVCDKSLFMPYTRATRDAKTATRGKSCKNVTDTTVKTANATLFRNLINARVQENACWSPPDPNHAIALTDAQNALSLCEN